MAQLMAYSATESSGLNFSRRLLSVSLGRLNYREEEVAEIQATESSGYKKEWS